MFRTIPGLEDVEWDKLFPCMTAMHRKMALDPSIAPLFVDGDDEYANGFRVDE